jgi:sugar phosphate isomerase/epimerase
LREKDAISLMTSLPAIGLQLYSLREALSADFAGTVRRVVAMGYAGVEPFGVPDNLTEAAALYRELGLQVPAAHVPMPLGDDKARTLRVAEAYGLKRIISMFGPDQYKTLDDVRRSCDRINEAARVAAENGLALGYHNHWWECQPVDGRYPYQIMLERLDPAIFFEIDVYWVKTGGIDPVGMVRELGRRAPLLHIKDGPAAAPEQPMVAVGDGSLDIPGIIQAGQGTEWLIVELDRCATDMFTAVQKSCAYLVTKGFGYGR